MMRVTCVIGHQAGATNLALDLSRRLLIIAQYIIFLIVWLLDLSFCLVVSENYLSKKREGSICTKYSLTQRRKCSGGGLFFYFLLGGAGEWFEDLAFMDLKTAVVNISWAEKVGYWWVVKNCQLVTCLMQNLIAKGDKAVSLNFVLNLLVVQVGAWSLNQLLIMYIIVQGDVETLKKYCSPELIERCKAEHTAYQSHGIFFDNKVSLQISWIILIAFLLITFCFDEVDNTISHIRHLPKCFAFLCPIKKVFGFHVILTFVLDLS